MTRTKNSDLGTQIGQQRDRLTESVGALADRVDTDAIRSHAEDGAEALLDSVTDSDGKPKRGLLIGLAVGVIALFLLRRALA